VFSQKDQELAPGISPGDENGGEKGAKTNRQWGDKTLLRKNGGGGKIQSGLKGGMGQIGKPTTQESKKAMVPLHIEVEKEGGERGYERGNAKGKQKVPNKVISTTQV